MTKGIGRSLAFLLVLLVLLAVVGCGSSEPKLSADEVVQNALAAQAGVTSSHVQTNITATVQGTLNGSTLDVSLTGEASGNADWANKKMKSQTELTIGYNDLPMTIAANIYAVDNYTYTQVTASGTTDNWTKSSLSMEFWSAQGNAEFIDGLLPYAEPESLADEKVGDVNCHVLRFTPDIAEIQQTLSQQHPELADVPSIANMVNHLSVVVWVAKDTSFVTKIQIEAMAHVTPEALGQTANGDALDINLTFTMEASNINEPVSIELPAEAQNAVEGSGLEILSGLIGM